MLMVECISARLNIRIFMFELKRAGAVISNNWKALARYCCNRYRLSHGVPKGRNGRIGHPVVKRLLLLIAVARKWSTEQRKSFVSEYRNSARWADNRICVKAGGLLCTGWWPEGASTARLTI